MPTAIIAGLPPDIDRRIQSALKQRDPFRGVWQVIWMRSKDRIPGLAPSQLDSTVQTASSVGGAHFFIFRGRDKYEEDLLVAKVAPYFRVRWVGRELLKLTSRSMDSTDQFFEAINQFLGEELEWIQTVKPHDESCCLLFQECAFSAAGDVRHLWTVASEAGIERIRLAARASEQFKFRHWLRHKNGSRAWIDGDDRVFDHRGPRHGVAPFPRAWKFSYQVVSGFHFDVTSRVLRAFHVHASDGCRHAASEGEHINIDPHGYVRA